MPIGLAGNVMILRRLDETESATYGVLSIFGQVRLCTLEPPWKNNERDISCCPVGNYVLHRHNLHGDPTLQTWALIDVPGRDPLAFHALNYYYQTKGCMGIGLGFQDHNGIMGLKDARLGMEYLRQLLGKRDNIPLRIINVNDR